MIRNMGSKHKETEKSKRNNGRNGTGKTEIERKSRKKKKEKKEQTTEKQQEKMCPKKDNVRTLTGNRKEIKKRRR